MIGIYLLTGIILGVGVTAPLAWWWNRATERRVRQLEREARTNERLAEVGAMTSGLAHEIKNPLSTVGLNVQLIQEDLQDIEQALPADSDLHDNIGRTQRRFTSLVRETQRLRDILEDFLRFAGRMELERVPVQINAMVDELADFFQPQAAEAKVNLRCQLSSESLVVDGDEGLLKQAVLNLLLNAIQAMRQAREKQQENGGADELIVSTEASRSLGKAVAEIHIMDTGPGMDATLASKIFQPYFSTKRSGTGLGLPTTRRIVEEHGGQIHVHGEPGRGTQFTIVLPISETNEANSNAGNTSADETGV